MRLSSLEPKVAETRAATQSIDSVHAECSTLCYLGQVFTIEELTLGPFALVQVWVILKNAAYTKLLKGVGAFRYVKQK